MDSINDALIDAVKSLGGSKQVGPLLWPEKTPDAAQRLLLSCLNEDRPEHLTPEHVLLILRKAKERGKHDAMEFILADLGYAPPQPIEPEDEMAALQRQFIEAQQAMSALVDRMAKVSPQLRAVA